MRRGIRQFIAQILLERAFDRRIGSAVNHILQISGKGCDMRIINAGISAELIRRQFATLPGTVKWMSQDGSFADQVIQGVQCCFGSHSILMLRRPVPERKSKKRVLNVSKAKERASGTNRERIRPSKHSHEDQKRQRFGQSDIQLEQAKSL